MAEEAILKFKCPTAVIISAPSGSGKTTLVFEILKRASIMFSKPPSQIIYCYGVYQNLYDDMKTIIDNLTFFEGLPSKENLEAWSIKGDHSLLILDDLMAKCSTSQDICDLFTAHSHHMNFSVFFLVQNLSPGESSFAQFP